MLSIKGTSCHKYFLFRSKGPCQSNAEHTLYARLNPQEGILVHMVKHLVSDGKAWGPQRLSKVSERRLKDDTDVPGTARVCHSLFVHVNLKAYQGSSVTEHKHTDLSKAAIYKGVIYDRYSHETGEGICHLLKHAKVAYLTL